jgi:hypothetical protein
MDVVCCNYEHLLVKSRGRIEGRAFLIKDDFYGLRQFEKDVIESRDANVP